MLVTDRSLWTGIVPMYVKIVFLNRELDKAKRTGFEVKEDKHKVCRLFHYGVKQLSK